VAVLVDHAEPYSCSPVDGTGLSLAEDQKLEGEGDKLDEGPVDEEF
jgi:hypothetical protein